MKDEVAGGRKQLLKTEYVAVWVGAVVFFNADEWFPDQVQADDWVLCLKISGESAGVVRGPEIAQLVLPIFVTYGVHRLKYE